VRNDLHGSVAQMSKTETADAVSAAAELDERRLQVVAEQAVGLRWQILLTAVIVCAIVWRAVPTALLIAWFAAVICSREWRAASLHRMARDRGTPIATRLRRTVQWNIVLGTCNGSAALFMAWLDPTLDSVLTMILVSWGAGAVSTSSTVMRAFVAYASLLFVPTAIMWLLVGGWLGWGIFTLVLMFFGVQTRFARHNLRTFEESFRMRLENESLARSLEIERAHLAVARDTAVNANRDKSRFLAAASHDLRQPLQAMALNVGALRHLLLEPDARSIAEVVDSSLEQLRSMLDALLDVSKLDSGVVAPERKRVQVDRLATAVVAAFGASAAARRISLTCACRPELAADTDPDLLRRMLANLLDNAIKFTPPGGKVEVKVDVDDGTIEIRVRDNGPGIAPENHRLIFEDLVQLEPREGAALHGHGLGLGIVRRLAGILEVSIGLDSIPGSGACFTLRLPEAAPSAATASIDNPEWSLAGRCVLVLDDDSMVRGAYVNSLAAMGCAALPAATLAEAMTQLAQLEPGLTLDAAVVDHRLGNGADGFAAIARLRAAKDDLPIVMVTADTDASVLETARREAVPLLRKPVDGMTLGRTLSAVIDMRNV
jgi:signal transduction histidine kinase/CheY-like chemotaxis protein